MIQALHYLDPNRKISNAITLVTSYQTWISPPKLIRSVNLSHVLSVLQMHSTNLFSLFFFSLLFSNIQNALFLVMILVLHCVDRRMICVLVLPHWARNLSFIMHAMIYSHVILFLSYFSYNALVHTIGLISRCF